MPTGSVLIVEGLNCLSRAEPLQAEAQLAQIVNAGITVVTASDGREYNRERLKAQPMDLVYSLLVMFRAHEESDTKSKRVKAAIRRQCQGWIAGTWRAPIRVGKDPHWVRKTEGGGFELAADRASAVRLVIEMFRQGHGAVRIVRELAERGLQISETGHTHSSHIYKILTNRMLIGEKSIEVDGETYRLDGYYPALLTPAEFADLRYLAEQRGRRKGKGGDSRRRNRPRDHLLRILRRRDRCSKPDGQEAPAGRSPLPRPPSTALRHLQPKCRLQDQRKLQRCSGRACPDAVLLRPGDLTRLLEGEAGTASVSAQLASARQRVAELEAQVRRVTAALLFDDGEAPAAVLRRVRELESQLASERRHVESFEHHLAASAVAPAAADAWRELVQGVEQLDYDARLMARQLVADTFSRIVIYQSGFQPDIDRDTIRVVLVGKRGNTRMLNVDRHTGDWCAAEDLHLSEATSIPLPGVTNP
ncbi:recombinase family protein [Burkholderia ubonensis]|uniref:recombinase family protein n=1 Tax=Burkholderia ubonensis TaxID=101571 RepID=UPI000ABFF2C7|nr:recombinase family protein [Burkholderia ubonensis]